MYEFRKQRTPEEVEALKNKQKLRAQQYFESEEKYQHSRKRKRSNDEIIPAPGAVSAVSADVEEVIYYEEYDNVDDLIEGPDDEDDDDL